MPRSSGWPACCRSAPPSSCTEREGGGPVAEGAGVRRSKQRARPPHQPDRFLPARDRLACGMTRAMGRRAMTHSLDHVYYWTRTLDRAVEFYRDVLGLPLLRQEGDQWALFDAGPVQFALHGVIDGHPVAPGGATAVFRVDDLDGAVRALEERGVAFHDHLGEVPGGVARFRSFSDPDGNTVQLIEYSGAEG